MQDFPHHYTVSGRGRATGNATLATTGAPDLATAPPAEFGGPGDQWSPESLLVGAVADCFIFSFRAIARVSRFDWTDLQVDVTGTLDKVERVTQFTGFSVKATLDVPEGTDEAKAVKLLEKAEHVCLITNSLKADSHLETEVRVAAS